MIHGTAAFRYADRVASKKQRPGKGKGPRQGISGNPQRRAGQLAQRRPAIAEEPEIPPLVLDLRSGKPKNSPLQDLAYALAGGAEPRPWWGESHRRILAAARALTWPSRLMDLETQACRIVGDEFYERLNSRVTGLHPPQWLRALVEETGAALRASVADGTGDWQQLWALLRGLALTAPPGDTDSETAKLARARFPDIKDPYLTALAEAGKAAKLLAARGLVSGIGHLADGCRAAGDPLVACDAYGSRFLLAAPFGYDGEGPDHWYAWDIDSCWVLTVAGAGVFGSAEDALAEWQHAVGPAAGTALSPSAPEMTARLLAPCLETGPLSDILQPPHSPTHSKASGNTGNSEPYTLSYSKNNPPAERMWFMPSVPAPADPGRDEDPAWLDRLCELEDDPFYAPQEYWDPEASAPPPGLDELTAGELAEVRDAAADEMLALDAASTGRRGPGHPGSARRFPGESASRAAAFGTGLVLDVMPGCPQLAVAAAPRRHLPLDHAIRPAVHHRTHQVPHLVSPAAPATTASPAPSSAPGSVSPSCPASPSPAAPTCAAREPAGRPAARAPRCPASRPAAPAPVFRRP